jgi:hypothetical protein
VSHLELLVARQARLWLGDWRGESLHSRGCQVSLGIQALLETELLRKRHAEFLLVRGAWLGCWAWCSCAELSVAGNRAHPSTAWELVDEQRVSAVQKMHVYDLVEKMRVPSCEVVLLEDSYLQLPLRSPPSSEQFAGGR